MDSRSNIETLLFGVSSSSAEGWSEEIAQQRRNLKILLYENTPFFGMCQDNVICTVEARNWEGKLQYKNNAVKK